MSKHNKAIRAAQRLLIAESKRYPPEEIAYKQYSADPRAEAYKGAAALIETLIEPEE